MLLLLLLLLHGSAARQRMLHGQVLHVAAGKVSDAPRPARQSCRTCFVPSPPPPGAIGSQCASYPPANFYTCCLNKAVSGKQDR